MLCVCSCSLLAFSSTVNAEGLSYDIRQDIYIMLDSTDIEEDFLNFTPNNNQEETSERVFDSYVNNDLITKNYFYRNVWNIFFDGDYPFELNKANRVSLENFYWAYLLNENGSMHYVRGYGDTETVYAVIEYVDGSSESININVSADNDLSLDMSFEFTPSQNVERLTIFVDSNIGANLLNTKNRTEITGYMGEINGDNKYEFVIDIQSEEAGLLSGLIGWVTNIFNKIGDIFSKLVDMLSEVKNIGTYLLQLPQKLWELIQTGLQYLFVPSEEDLSIYFDSMNNLIENKFGGLYQVVSILSDDIGEMIQSDITNSIEMPLTTINLPDENSFSFGGYNVFIVPEGFETIATIIKAFTSAACTLMFINALKKRFDKLVGGGNDV